MDAQAVESTSPIDGGASLVAQVEDKLRELAKAIIAEVSARYEQAIAEQVGLLQVENEELRERLQAFEAQREPGVRG